jgi:head-tail adaptor
MLNPMNKPVAIQSQAATQDAFGQELQTWTTIFACFASIDVQRSALIYSTAEFVSKVVYRIETWWPPGIIIAANQRVLYVDANKTTHTFEIQSVLNDKMDSRKLIILAYELDGTA